jgi:hypothetical protein
MQVEELTRISEVIDDKNVGNAMRVKLVNQIAADKPRSARNNVHAFCPLTKL